MATPSSDERPAQKVCAEWTAVEVAELVVVLLKVCNDGTQAKSGWKAVTWTLVVKTLAAKFEPVVAKQAVPCKMHWQCVSAMSGCEYFAY
jgi:hypothetical protein